MGHHFVQTGIGVLWTIQRHNFHLIKLVQPVQAPNVLAVGACLAAEAGGIGGIADGQFGLVHNHIAVQIGHRHFRRGNGVEVVGHRVVHLALLVGKLSGPKAGGLVNKMRRLHLAVPCGGILVQEKLNQRALQAGAFVQVNGESSTGDLYPQFKVNQAVLGGQIPVRDGAWVQGGNASGCAYHLVVFGTFAHRHAGMRRVGDGNQKSVQGIFGIAQHRLQTLGGLLQCGGLLLGRIGLFFLSGFEEIAYRLGEPVGLCQAIVQFDLGRAAHVVRSQQLVYHSGAVKASFLKSGHGRSAVRAKRRKV